MATILLDPGHGGSDPGAVYFGRTEAADNLRMAQAVASILRARGCRVEMTRNNDTFVSLQQRAQNSNNLRPDMFVSIHRNASEIPTATGLENYIWTNASTRARQIAQTTLDAIASEAPGIRNRGLHTANFYVLRFTDAPAQLLELGFMNNPDDNKWFDDNFHAIATGIADGITTSLGPNGCRGGGTPTPPAPPTVTPSRETVREIQSTLNSHYSAGLSTDGIAGPLTKRALMRAFQMQLNSQGANLSVDGHWGPATRAAAKTISRGDRGNLVWILQAALNLHGANLTMDGVFGPATEAAVRSFQQSQGLAADGVVGSNTWGKVLP